MGNLYLGDPIIDPTGPQTGPNVRRALTYNNPRFSNDNNRGSNGDSYYNAVNVQFTTNDIHHSGLSVVANYTYAHALDDLSSTFSDSGVGNNVGGLGYMNFLCPRRLIMATLTSTSPIASSWHRSIEHRLFQG